MLEWDNLEMKGWHNLKTYMPNTGIYVMIHNTLKDGSWSYNIDFVNKEISENGFDTFEEARASALMKIRTALNKDLEIISEEINNLDKQAALLGL